MESKWYKCWGKSSKRDSKQSEQIDEQLLDFMCHRMQKSFDSNVDKLLRKLMEYHLCADFYTRGGEFVSDDKRNLFRQQLTIKLLNNYIKHFRKKKEKPKNCMLDPRYQEIVEYCTTGQYRLLSGETWSKPNIFQDRLERPLQIFWDINKVTDMAKFSYEPEANKLFGLQQKRLIRFHPHLIHYILDKEDIHWLKTNGLLNDKLKRWRLSIVLFDQLRELRETDNTYRKYCSDINFKKLKAFKLPKFMLKKIRFYIIRLQIKTNGTITIVAPPPNTEKKCPMVAASNQTLTNTEQHDRTNKAKAPQNKAKAPQNTKRQTKKSHSKISLKSNKQNLLKSKSQQNLQDNNNQCSITPSEETLTPWNMKVKDNTSQETIRSSANQMKLHNDGNSKATDSDVTLAPKLQTSQFSSFHLSHSQEKFERKYLFTSPMCGLRSRSRSCCCCGVKSSESELVKTQRLVCNVFGKTTPLNSPKSSLYSFQYPSMHQIRKRT